MMSWHVKNAMFWVFIKTCYFRISKELHSNIVDMLYTCLNLLDSNASDGENKRKAQLCNINDNFRFSYQIK